MDVKGMLLSALGTTEDKLSAVLTSQEGIKLLDEISALLISEIKKLLDKEASG